MQHERKQIVRNLGWSVVGKAYNILGAFLSGVIVARYLGPEQYGLMNYVISYVFLFQTLAQCGLDGIEIREEAKGQEDYRLLIGTATGIRLIAGSLMVGAALLTSYLMDANAEVFALVAIYSVVIWASSLTTIRNYFMSQVKNEYVVKSEIVRTTFCLLIKLMMMLLHANLYWFMFACSLDVVLLGTGYWAAYRSQIGSIREWCFSWAVAKRLLTESLPLLLTSAAVIVYQRIDQVMLGQMVDNEAVGYFATACRFAEVLLLVPSILADTFVPVLVAEREQDEASYRQMAQRFMSLTTWLCMILAALVAALAWPLIRYTFGADYLPAVVLLQVLCIKAVTNAVGYIGGRMIIIEGIQRVVFLRDVLGCMVCVGLNWLLLPHYGAVAAAVVAILSSLMAGYLADALIPSFRTIFRMQTRSLFLGWLELKNVKNIIKN